MQQFLYPGSVAVTHRSVSRFGWVFGAVFLAVFVGTWVSVGCSQAFGWSAVVDGGGKDVVVSAGVGEVNVFEVDDSGDGRSVVVRDLQAGNVFVGPVPVGCVAAAGGVSCLSGVGGVNQVKVVAGDMDDRVDNVSGRVGVLVEGGDGNDRLTGSGMSEVFQGGPGNDVARLGGGNDGFDGGPGDDQAFGGDGVDDLVDTGGGDDRLAGGEGQDHVLGGDGADILSGGAGSDSISGEGGVDAVAGGDGNDVISGGDGNDLLEGDNGDDVLDGSDGDDAISGGEGTDRVTGSGGNDVVRSDGGDDELSGGDGDDRIDGGPGTNTLLGGNGNDVLNGFESSDTIHGEAGDDMFTGGQGADDLSGGDGSDQVSYEDSPGGVQVSVNDVADDGAGGESDNARSDIEQVTGSSGPDILTGARAVANVLVGGPGDDTIVDRGGASSPADELRCNEGKDTIDGDSNDRVTDDCEKVTIDGQVVRDGTQSKPSLSLVSHTILVTKTGKALIDVGCAPNDLKTPCEGALTLQRSTGKSEKTQNAFIAKRSFVVVAGMTSQVKLSIPKKLVKRLRVPARGKGRKAWLKLDLKTDTTRVSSRIVLVHLLKATRAQQRAQARQQAITMFKSTFPQTVATLSDSDALVPRPTTPIVSFLSDNVARLASSDGKGRLLVTNRPLRAKTSDGSLEQVDFRLTQADDGFTPKNAPFVLKINKTGGGFTLGPKEGKTITVTPIKTDGTNTSDQPAIQQPEGTGNSQAAPDRSESGSDASSSSQQPSDRSGAVDSGEAPASEDLPSVAVGESRLFPQTAKATDTLVAPKIDGVETFEQIHSPQAPEVFSYRVGLPSGRSAQLENGMIRIINSDGMAEVMALPPTAIDAAGNTVPVKYELDQPTAESAGTGDGERSVVLRVVVDHRREGVAYPVLVDPTWASSYDYVGDPETGIGGITEFYTGSGPGSPWYDVGLSGDAKLPGFVIYPIGGRVFSGPGAGGKVIYRAPGHTAKIQQVIWRHVNHVNAKERQYLRLALYGSDAPQVFDDGAGPMTDATVKQIDPKGALTAEIWIHTPACKVGEPACPRLVANPSKSLVRVGAMDLTLTDDDYPEIYVASGNLYDIRDRWTTGKGRHTVKIIAKDRGSGIFHYQLESINLDGTSSILDEVPEGSLCDEKHRNLKRQAFICDEQTDGPEQVITDLQEGKHTFKASAEDYVRQSSDDGNTSVIWSTYVDRTKPEITASGSLKEKENVWLNPLGETVIHLKATDDRSGVQSYTFDGYDSKGNNIIHDTINGCPSPGPIETPCPTRTGDKITIDTDNLPPGPVRFEAIATDVAGNTSDPEQWTVYVDRRSPIGRASGDLTKLEGVRTTEDKPVEVELQGKDSQGGSGITTLTLQAVDGEGNETILAHEEVCDTATHDGETPCPQSVTRTAMVDLTKLPDGPTKFTVTATDLAGNKSKDNETWDTYIDQTPPAPPTNIQIKARTEDTAIITWDRSPDIDVAQYTYQLEVNGERVNTGTTTPFPQATIHIVPKATIAVIIKSIDKAKNESKVVSKTGKVANSGLLDLESEMLAKKKDPRFHPCKGGKGAKCGHYDGKKAAEYARKYAKYPYNTDYHHFDSVDAHSGDCTNYISQALHAGGMALTGDAHTTTGVSWYGTKNTWTATWIDTNYFHDHFLTDEYGSFTRMRQLRSGEEVRIGDVIQVYPIPEGDDKRNYFHTVMVTNFIGKGDGRRRLSYHSEDEKDFRWDKFKVRMDDRFTKGGWSHIIERPIYTKVNIK